MPNRMPWRGLGFLSLLVGAFSISFWQTEIRNPGTAFLVAQSGPISSCGNVDGQGGTAQDGTQCYADYCTQVGTCQNAGCRNCGAGGAVSSCGDPNIAINVDKACLCSGNRLGSCDASGVCTDCSNTQCAKEYETCGSQAACCTGMECVGGTCRYTQGDDAACQGQPAGTPCGPLACPGGFEMSCSDQEECGCSSGTNEVQECIIDYGTADPVQSCPQHYYIPYEDAPVCYSDGSGNIPCECSEGERGICGDATCDCSGESSQCAQVEENCGGNAPNCCGGLTCTGGNCQPSTSGTDTGSGGDTGDDDEDNNPCTTASAGSQSFFANLLSFLPWYEVAEGGDCQAYCCPEARSDNACYEINTATTTCDGPLFLVSDAGLPSLAENRCNNACASDSTPDCGDGVIEGTEDCDDSNIANGDGCSEVCSVEDGWSCEGEPSDCTRNPACGNDSLDEGETCEVIDGEFVSSGPPLSWGDCRFPGDTDECTFCGDKVINGDETCESDDPNCRLNCTFCGDGKINKRIEDLGGVYQLYTEECDDGNTVNGDGCSDSCENETNDACPDDPNKTEPGVCGCGVEDKDRDGRPGIDCPAEGSLCGNEFVDEDDGETCDFINGRSDYVSNLPTWGTCREINEAGACTYCGDGVVSTATDDDGNRIETCDEGLENDNNGTCRPNCTFCGDGIKNKNFVWDDQGNYTLVDEECDDGNRNNDDNCDNNCRDRTPPPCPPAGQTCCETFDDNNDGEIDDPSELQVTRGSGEACGKKLCVWCDARPDKPGRESCNVGFTSECAQCDPPADAGPDWEPDAGCICSTPSTICNARECSTPYEGNCRDFKQCSRADQVDCWVRRNGKRYERGYITVNLRCTEPVGGGAADATCRSTLTNTRPRSPGGEGGAEGGAPPPATNPGGNIGGVGGVPGSPVFPNQPLNPSAPTSPNNPSTPIVPGPSSRSSQISTGLICPDDVKICPDGSEVGRVGPDCEFPACPPVTSSRSSAISFSFSQQSSQCPDDVKICPDGRELRRGPTCQFPDCPSHLECQDQACAVVPGPGPNTCSTDDDCKDNKFLTCIANACTEIIGRQANDCSSDDDCAVPQRLECVGQTCTLVPGAGANRCEDNADCESPMRLACEDKQCVMVFGAGANECDNDQDCEDDQFFGCENNACTLLPGSRQEQCSTDFECQPASSAPSSIALSSGASETSQLSELSSSIAASAVTSPPRSSTSQTSQSSQQASLPDEIPPNCGDGNIDPGEECDDGLLNSNRRRNRCRLDCRLFFCGDGIVDSQNNETCDDANPFDNDGCSSECRTEIPASSEPSSISASSTTSTLIAQSSESEDSSRRNQRRSSRPRLITVNPDEDDDDNTTESSSSRRMVAAAPICGNGTLDQNEECDDSNRRDNDGCSSECQLEIGICGDGIIQRLLGEQCEQVLHDTTLPYFCEQCRFVSPSCGDGILDPGEECDEGSQNSNEPNGNCRLSCYFGGCGDGIQDQNEQCDDGNGINGDGCSRRCRIEQAKSSSSASSTSSQTPQQRITTVANELIRQGVAPQMAMMMAQMQVQSEQQRINFPFPTTPTGQPLPAQLPLAQLQPLIQTQAPVGDTGPAAVAVIGAGAAAGFSFMRRRK